MAFPAPPTLSSFQLSGEVQLFEAEPGHHHAFEYNHYSLSSLVSSPQPLSVKLASGDCYRLVVVLSGMTARGGQNNPPGIVTSYTNLRC